MRKEDKIDWHAAFMHIKKHFFPFFSSLRQPLYLSLSQSHLHTLSVCSSQPVYILCQTADVAYFTLLLFVIYRILRPLWQCAQVDRARASERANDSCAAYFSFLMMNASEYGSALFVIVMMDLSVVTTFVEYNAKRNHQHYHHHQQ